MSETIFAAATRLADILERENAALRALDFPAATALHDEKAGALACLSPPAESDPRGIDRALAERLKALAMDNRALLAMALGVQGRVIEVIAGSIARQMAQSAPVYCVGAPRAVGARPAAIAVSAQA
jgi:hypothetical protein